jgi:hypothetical protein
LKQRLESKHDQWPELPSAALKLRCYDIEKKNQYIAVKQVMTLSASFSEVEKIIDNFSDYQSLYDLKEVSILSNQGQKRTIKFVQSIPILKDLEFQLHYFMSFFSPPNGKRTKTYFYRLGKSEKIIANDGFIIIRENSQNLTDFIEFDSWDSNWSMLRFLGQEFIWKKNLEEIAKFDLILKLRVENPNWSVKKIHSEVKEFEIHSLINECFAKKRSIEEFW